MPTVAVEGQFRFVVNTSENTPSNLPTYMFGLVTKTFAG